MSILLPTWHLIAIWELTSTIDGQNWPVPYEAWEKHLYLSCRFLYLCQQVEWILRKWSALARPVHQSSRNLTTGLKETTLFDIFWIDNLKCSCSGWPTGNGNNLSNSQACCLAQLCLAAAQFLSISCGPSWARALYRADGVDGPQEMERN